VVSTLLFFLSSDTGISHRVAYALPFDNAEWMRCVEREGMNLGQAIRQVGDRRMIVDRGQEFLTVLIQRRSKSRWIPDDNGGGVRYLSLCSSDGLSDIERIRTVLPLCSQALLLPACDDWQAIERGDL
jgi:hypothetical protein